MFGSVGVKLVSVAAVQEGVHFPVVQVDVHQGGTSHYLYMIRLSLTNTVSDNKIQISILILRRGALFKQA